MTAPDEYQAALKYIQDWTPDRVIDYVSSLQSALADRDAKIASLQAKCDDHMLTLGKLLGALPLDRIVSAGGSVADLIAGIKKVVAERDRLQARLDAGPTVEQMRHWAMLAVPRYLVEPITETANRMEAANAE